MRLFATDDMSTGFDHVWVTIKQVSLTAASGDRVIFDDPAGRIIDLKTLRDAAGRRFNLLSNRAISSGKFAGLKVVVNSDLNVFPTGATTATAATFDGSTTGGTKTLSVDFASPRDLLTGTNLIVDFDLSKWTLTGNVVSATDNHFLNIVEDSRVDDPLRHELDDYHGTISNLSGAAPDSTFTLTQRNGTVNVKTDANASIFQESAAGSPSLTNGERVEVTGVFSTSANAIIATTIKIDDVNDNDPDQVKGQISSFSADTKTAVITIVRSHGFVPTNTTLTLQFADTTKFFSHRGVTLTSADFFAQVANGNFIEAEGTISGDTFTVTKAKLEDEVGHHGEGGGHHGGDGNHDGAELTGTISDLAADAGTFTLTVTRWEGLMLSSGAKVSVTTSASTEFKLNGATATKAAFFAALATATSVQVEGTYDDATKSLAATEIKIGDNGGGGHGGGGGGGND
ncbi:hypothetical protein OP10G_3437 [Fimbriimonas ginsengisoli Gsoil 348]|uniref:DUF5666 domain-containing protein n=1 Tax=Fimbriimonas ginsengisoli Gsoil 348 TaxID=661478 RepID=A0A068NVI7_FIMGI|nr:hypothetical protein OP10G_3437 [Fimbriimonas ginsengisoli Gsoil 348]